MYTLRIYQLQEYTREAIEEIDYQLNNDDWLSPTVGSCSDGTEHSESYIQTQNTLSTLSKLIHFLENNAYDKIHLNAYCSSFDCEILDALDGVKSSDDMIDVVGYGKICMPSN